MVFTPDNNIMGFSSILIFNYFSILFREKRKIRNEYKTKKTAFQKDSQFELKSLGLNVPPIRLHILLHALGELYCVEAVDKAMVMR